MASPWQILLRPSASSAALVRGGARSGAHRASSRAGRLGRSPIYGCAFVAASGSGVALVGRVSRVHGRHLVAGGSELFNRRLLPELG
jgi:hypothetical protein